MMGWMFIIYTKDYLIRLANRTQIYFDFVILIFGLIINKFHLKWELIKKLLSGKNFAKPHFEWYLLFYLKPY